MRLSALLACTVAAFGSASPAMAQDAQPAGEMTRAELIEMAKEVQQEVEAIRGWKFKRPVETDVYAEPQLRKFIEKRLFEEQYGGGKLEQTQAFLRMIGLIPSDCDLKKTIMDVLLNQIGGFYDPPSQKFYMMQREGVHYGPFVNRILVAHELTHALDDQYFSLDKLMQSREQTEDWGLAIGALVEGSATQLMTVYAAQAQASGRYDMAQLAQVARDEMQRSQPLLEAPRYFTSLVACYLCGMFFVTRGQPQLLTDADGGPQIQKNLLAAAEDPPLTTEHVLHPEKYWNKARRDYPVMVDDARMEKLLASAGRHVVHRNTVGELLCGLLTSDPAEKFDMIVSASPTYWTNEAATGWGGDRFYLIGAGKDAASAGRELRELTGIWITMWDTREDRNEFLADYEANRTMPKRGSFKLGDRAAVFTFALDPKAQAEVKKSLESAPPPFLKDGKSWSAEEK